ncbi:MAG: GNAT family N-acetyltransferase [Solirubrobacterales bacterium]|nr:GNAT family N-acetyltransferase [Solirubrobacterales bacterium]
MLADRVTTERLVLRRPEPGDVPALQAIFTDHRVDEAAWPADLRTADDARRITERAIAHWERFRFGPWTAEERATGRIIGRGGVNHTTVGGRPEVEIGYFISADHWGQGYATELAREAVRVAFEVLELDDVVLFTTPANAGSQAVIRKLGAEFEREVEHAGLPHVLFRLRRPA